MLFTNKHQFVIEYQRIIGLGYLFQLFTINTVYYFSCSLNCWNEHKTVECSTTVTEKVQEKVDSEFRSLYNFPTEDTVPLEKLELLGKLFLTYMAYC